jgi:hypothetical protein
MGLGSLKVGAGFYREIRTLGAGTPELFFFLGFPHRAKNAPPPRWPLEGRAALTISLNASS